MTTHPDDKIIFRSKYVEDCYEDNYIDEETAMKFKDVTDEEWIALNSKL